MSFNNIYTFVNNRFANPMYDEVWAIERKNFRDTKKIIVFIYVFSIDMQ